MSDMRYAAVIRKELDGTLFRSAEGRLKKRECQLIILMVSSLILLCTTTMAKAEKLIDLKMSISEEELQKKRAVKSKENMIIFGFDLRRSVEEDTRQYVPFLNYLERTTGYRFDLRFTPEDATIADDLGRGVIHFGAVGADTYLMTKARYGAIIVVRGLNSEERAEYQSVFIARPGSSISSVEELRGKRFAFGSKSSTQGHLIPRIVLAQHGIMLEDLGGYGWTGSHSNCANEVTAGHFDAGGMQDLLGRELAEAGLIKIFYTSKYYPSSGIAANRDVDPTIIAGVKKALINFEPGGKDAEGLYHWDKTEMANGFKEAFDHDYAELDEWAKRLGFY